MSSLWFDEPEKDNAHTPFDPWKKREDKFNDEQKQKKIDRLASSPKSPRSRANSKSGIQQFQILSDILTSTRLYIRYVDLLY